MSGKALGDHNYFILWQMDFLFKIHQRCDYRCMTVVFLFMLSCLRTPLYSQKSILVHLLALEILSAHGKQVKVTT